MENNTSPANIPLVPSQQTPNEPVKPNNLKVVLIILAVIEVVTILVASYFAYQFIQLKKQVSTNQPAPVPTITEQASPTPDVTANWKQYISPEIGDYVSPFQISYPPTWTIEEKLTSEEPKSLTLSLKNSANETIKITQGMGGGGSCIYSDDPDYTNFEGMGQFYSSYIQLNKPALWRISLNKDKTILSRTICEKTKTRYIDSTRIGWISVDVKSEASIQEVKTILETTVFKPTSRTKTLFD